MNENMIWSSVIIDQLVTFGVEYACIGAGSRSTPLTLAAVTHPNLKTYSFVDERSAAFFGLGIAKATNKPVILICTSGSATVNFFPAIVEAKQSNIPLIVLTADRPKELQESGANQTMDQEGIYGKMVVWEHTLRQPYVNPSDRTIRYLLAIARRAYTHAMYMGFGPVHLNFHFAKPLHSSDYGIDSQELSRKYTQHLLQGYQLPIVLDFDISDKIISDLQSLIEDQQVIVIIGNNSQKFLSTSQLLQMGKQLEAPIFVDAASNFRYNPELKEISPLMITTYETFLQNQELELPKPSLVIEFGEGFISKYLEEFLNKTQPTRIHIWPFLEEYNPLLDTRMRISSTPDSIISKLDFGMVMHGWANKWLKIEQKVRQEYQGMKFEYEASVIRSLIQDVNYSDLTLFVSNSLQVRHMDQFVEYQPIKRKIFTSRGVSGIDGNISTALGIGVGAKTTPVLIIGDLAFYHDITALLAIMRYNLSLHIILVNNSGGAIFDRLPINKFDKIYIEYFRTTHELQFDKIAAQFEITHKFANLQNFKDLYTELLADKGSFILEIKIKPKESAEKTRQEITKQILDNL